MFAPGYHYLILTLIVLGKAELLGLVLFLNRSNQAYKAMPRVEMLQECRCSVCKSGTARGKPQSRKIRKKHLLADQQLAESRQRNMAINNNSLSNAMNSDISDIYTDIYHNPPDMQQDNHDLSLDNESGPIMDFMSFRINPPRNKYDSILLNFLRLKSTRSLSDSVMDSILENMCNLDSSWPYPNYKLMLKRLNFLIPCFQNCYPQELGKHYLFSLTQFISMTFQSERRRALLEYGWQAYINGKNEENRQITDVWSGQRVQELVDEGLLRPGIDIPILLTGDGLQIFTDRSYECGFLDVSLLLYPPYLRGRPENTHVYGILGGPTAPTDMQKTLQPFFDELQSLEDKGVVTLSFDGKTNVRRKVCVLLISGDLKYLEKLDYKKATGSYFNCRYCRIEGERGGVSGRTVYYPVSTGRDCSSRSDAALRTSLKSLQSMDKVEVGQLTKNLGYNGFPILFNLKSLKFAVSITVDMMHFFSNFSKTLWKIFCNDIDFGKPHHNSPLGMADWKRLTNIVSNSSWPSSFCGGRRPATPMESGVKAIQHKFFVLHLIVPLLFSTQQIPSSILIPLADLIDILKVLVDKDGCLDLIQTQNLQDELNECYLLLESEILRGKGTKAFDFCTSNTHNLQHMVQSFINYGPPSNYSQWSLESKLGDLKLLVHRRSNPEATLAKNVDVFSRAFLLDVEAENSNPVISSFNSIDGYLCDRKCANTFVFNDEFTCCLLAFIQTNAEEYANQESSWASEIDSEDQNVIQ